jgi:hypothetical protein
MTRLWWKFDLGGKDTPLCGVFPVLCCEYARLCGNRNKLLAPGSEFAGPLAQENC